MNNAHYTQETDRGGMMHVELGDRVQLHPATDWWMRGARYGRVIALGKKVTVELDMGRRVILRWDDITEVVK